MESHDSIFDKFMEMAGDDGPFQKRFNYIFNAGMVVFGSLAYMNIILALNVPEHWCHVPGREFTNYTINEWKQMTLPRYVLILFIRRHIKRPPKRILTICQTHTTQLLTNAALTLNNNRTDERSMR